MTWVKPCDPEKSLPICDAHRESWMHRKTVKIWCIQEQPDFPIIPVFIILASWSEISLKSMTKCSLFFYDAHTSNKQLQLFCSKFSSSKHFGHEGKSPSGCSHTHAYRGAPGQSASEIYLYPVAIMPYVLRSKFLCKPTYFYSEGQSFMIVV